MLNVAPPRIKSIGNTCFQRKASGVPRSPAIYAFYETGTSPGRLLPAKSAAAFSADKVKWIT
jgi:hypothetical protein